MSKDDIVPKKRGRKIIYDDDLHKAWRISTAYRTQQDKLKGKIK